MSATRGAYEQSSEFQFQQRLKECRNTEIDKARMWKNFLDEKHILTFKAACGRILTAGPYQQAVGHHPGYALFGLSKEYHDNSWGIALRIVEYCGRVKPLNVAR